MTTSPYDAECADLADRHYSRRTIGARQFAYAGRKLVLRDTLGLIVFVWMFPDPTMREDGQIGYNNALFRNESPRRSSEIILEAEQWACRQWGPARAYTYVDPRHIHSHNPGFCFKCAGWRFVRRSLKGKHLLEKHLVMDPDRLDNPRDDEADA
jgi:hypothetical protein